MGRSVVLFARLGHFSNINDAVRGQLERGFPEADLLDVDVLAAASRELASFRNWIQLAREYGPDFLFRRKHFRRAREWLTVTSHAFHVVTETLKAATRGRKLLFSFQTQSMFDGRIDPSTPHFVYTDSTVLANYQYPGLEPRSFLKSSQWMRLEPRIYHNATINFVFSHNQSWSLVEQYHLPPARVVCAYCGSNAPLGRDASEYGRHYGDKNVLFVGVNWERKGGPQLLGAFLRVLGKHPSATLTVVGCSPDVVHPNVRVLGKIPLPRVDEELARASVFCMPTTQEPFGVVFVEAMHRRLPIVATNIGALPDMVESGVNGFLVPPGDTDALLASLLRLLDSPELCEVMGAKGRARALEHYRWDHTGSILAEHIRPALPDPGSRHAMGSPIGR